MSTIKGFLTEDHGRCDELFAKMEDAVTQSIENAKEAYDAFAEATERHFQMEERVMFLEFEQKTGMTQGPTAIMRHEHAQMRNLVAEMGKAIEAKDKDKFFGNSETLMIFDAATQYERGADALYYGATTPKCRSRPHCRYDALNDSRVGQRRRIWILTDYRLTKHRP